MNCISLGSPFSAACKIRLHSLYLYHGRAHIGSSDTNTIKCLLQAFKLLASVIKQSTCPLYAYLFIGMRTELYLALFPKNSIWILEHCYGDHST